MKKNIFFTKVKGLFRWMESYRSRTWALGVTLAAIDDGVVSTDINGAILAVNASGQALTGYTEKDLKGRQISDVLNFIDPVSGALQKLSRERFFCHIEKVKLNEYVKLTTLDGKENYVSVTCSPMKSPDKKVIGFVIVLRNVTDEYKARRDLKESNKRFKALFEHSSVATVVHDKETGEILDANARALEMYGFESVVDLKRGSFWGEKPFSFEDALRYIRSTGDKKPQYFEWMAKRSSGEIFWEDVRLVVVPLDGTERVLAVTTDISERKKTEEALRVSQKRLMRINGCLLGLGDDFKSNIDRMVSLCGELLGATYAMYNKIENGRLCCASKWHAPPEFVPSGGLEKSICGEVIRREGDDVLVIEDLQTSEFAESDPNILRHGLRSYMGKSVKLKGEAIGALCVVYSEHYVPSDNDQITISLLALAVGSEEVRRESLRRITESEERFRALVSNVPGVIFRCANDQQWTMWFVSDRVKELCGHSAEGFIGNSRRSYSSIIHVDDRVMVSRTIGEKILAGEHYDVTYRINCANGAVKWVYESGQGVPDPNGNVAYIDGVIMDITDTKNAENVRKNFVSMVSHELRTPLTAIKGSITLVRDKAFGELNEEQRKFLDISISNIDRLTRLINDVLDFEKVDSGKDLLRMESGNLNDLVSDVSEIMELQARNKGLALAAVTDETLPVTLFDKDKMTQVLANLLNNAVKFTSEGKITVSTKEKDGEVEISVKDTGPGIDPEEMFRVFKPFHQIKRSVGGAGLGLSICKNIVERHGGRIWVLSGRGEGSDFRFTIPIRRKEDE